MTITLSEFIILILATFRISALLVWDKGPFDLFQKIRKLAGIEYIETQEGVALIKLVPETLLAELFDCIRCMSVWVAGAVLLLWVLPIPVIDIIIVFFAVAGGVYLIHLQMD